MKKMTREEAIEILIDQKDNDVFVSEWRDKIHEALKMAIQSLQTEPCEDAISRKQAIDEIRRWFDLIKLNPDILIDAIVTLPSVTLANDINVTTTDAISRYAAIEEIRNLKIFVAGKDIFQNEAKETIIKTLDELPSVQREQKWIPCKERLPNTIGVYNVTRHLVDGSLDYFISDVCYFDGSDTWHDDNRVNSGRPYLKDVVAWMPLPEPWEEGE